jgi:transcriptional regulator with XRE-family HTH domain
LSIKNEGRREEFYLLFENVSALCQKNGISFYRLERDLDIGNGRIARWKEQSPSVETVKKVADYFSVTVDELLSDDGNTVDGC